MGVRFEGLNPPPPFLFFLKRSAEIGALRPLSASIVGWCIGAELGAHWREPSLKGTGGTIVLGSDQMDPSLLLLMHARTNRQGHTQSAVSLRCQLGMQDGFGHFGVALDVFQVFQVIEWCSKVPCLTLMVSHFPDFPSPLCWGGSNTLSPHCASLFLDRPDRHVGDSYLPYLQPSIYQCYSQARSTSRSPMSVAGHVEVHNNSTLRAASTQLAAARPALQHGHPIPAEGLVQSVLSIALMSSKSENATAASTSRDQSHVTPNWQRQPLPMMRAVNALLLPMHLFHALWFSALRSTTSTGRAPMLEGK